MADRLPRPPDVPQHPHRDVPGRPAVDPARRQPHRRLREDVRAAGDVGPHAGPLRGRDQRILRLGQRRVRRLRPGRLHAGGVRHHQQAQGRDATRCGSRCTAGAPAPTWRTTTSGGSPASSARSGSTRRRRTYLQDVTIKTDLDAQYRDATISADVEIGGPSEGHTVRTRLFDPQGREVAVVDGKVANPLKWTDETPNVYELRIELLKDGRVDPDRQAARRLPEDRDQRQAAQDQRQARPVPRHQPRRDERRRQPARHPRRAGEGRPR